MYTVTLGGSLLYQYHHPGPGGGVRAYGWCERDSVYGRPGTPVAFATAEEAQAWVQAHGAFARGAAVVPLPPPADGGDGGRPPMPTPR